MISLMPELRRSGPQIQSPPQRVRTGNSRGGILHLASARRKSSALFPRAFCPGKSRRPALAPAPPCSFAKASEHSGYAGLRQGRLDCRFALDRLVLAGAFGVNCATCVFAARIRGRGFKFSDPECKKSRSVGPALFASGRLDLNQRPLRPERSGTDFYPT